MILSDRSIRERLDSGSLDVEPEPAAGQIQPASLDVTLGSGLYNPLEDEEHDVQKRITVAPGQFVLCHTREVIDLPDDLAAQVTGRSTLGRLGLCVHVTAGWIDPGFRGDITLEMCNFSNEPVTIDVGERVAQLVFFRTDEPTSGYSGQYQGQRGPTRAGETS